MRTVIQAFELVQGDQLRVFIPTVNPIVEFFIEVTGKNWLTGDVKTIDIHTDSELVLRMHPLKLVVVDRQENLTVGKET